MHVLTVNGGVFPALVPESISVDIALDYTERLARNRRVAACAYCNRAVVLSNQQAGRARKGLPVYHDECARVHRLDYHRGYRANAGGTDWSRATWLHPWAVAAYHAESHAHPIRVNQGGCAVRCAVPRMAQSERESGSGGRVPAGY